MWNKYNLFFKCVIIKVFFLVVLASADNAFQQSNNQNGGQVNPINPANKKSGRVSNTNSQRRLSEHEYCVDDVAKYCKPRKRFDAKPLTNFETLKCLSDVEEGHVVIAPACQHLLFEYKINLTKDSRFEAAALQVCTEDLDRIEECREANVGPGQKLSCLLEHADGKMTDLCARFVKKMKPLVFTDYRLIFHFVDNCKQDIRRSSCGRFENPKDGHSQGAVIECLAKDLQRLEPQCKKAVLRVAELQSDDFHLDRALYHACYDDRERLCERVQSGDGRVYKCLMRHMRDPSMSDECKEKLRVRERLLQEDVQVDKAFVTACLPDLKDNTCLSGVQDVKFEHGRVAAALTCLEGKLKNGEHVSGKCIAEMTRIQKAFISDYSVNLDIVANCHSEISEHCGGGLQKGGQTMHCLMKLAKVRPKKTDLGKSERPMSATCQRAVEAMLELVQPADDWRIDPVLVEACEDTVQSRCAHVEPGSGRVVDCLMNLVGTNKIDLDCQDSLLELQYFIARDWRLTPRLYNKCHADAVKICDAKPNWHTPGDNEPSHGPLVLTCLYRTVRNMEDEDYDDDDENDTEETDKLNPECVEEVKRTIRHRALSVDLNPEVEENCLQDLSFYCSNSTKKGEELLCLQRNFKDLESECKKVIRDMTEYQNRDTNVDVLLMRACLPAVQQYCKELMSDGGRGEIMDCLIRNKYQPEMPPKCRAGIEHHQIISLQDIHFSHKFKEACKTDAGNLCKDSKTKYDIVSCLSQKVRDATLHDQLPPVKVGCSQLLRVELLQRSGDINLDLDLKKACKDDVKKFCSNYTPGNAMIIDCLKQHQRRLSDQCARVLFKREKQENQDVRTDFKLQKACGSAIRDYCKDSKPSEVFSCLRRMRRKDDFPAKCRDFLHSRMQLRAKDIRLNPALEKACGKDVDAFCMEEKNAMKDSLNDGSVITCLRRVYASKDKNKKLHKECRKLIKVRIAEAHQDYSLDPILGVQCKNELENFCSREVYGVKDGELGPGAVEECLKTKLINERKDFSAACRQEVVRIVQEGEPDIHVDVQLFKECQQDLRHYCQDVPLGEGRQMSCILDVLQEGKVAMDPQCKKVLVARKRMWEYAAKFEGPNSIADAADQIMSSPARHSILAICLSVLGVIFILGLTCGRFTKRVAYQEKVK